MNLDQTTILKLVAKEVEFRLQDAEAGHDWLHIQRVWKNAQLISLTEEADQFIVELAALLHDIADSKFNNGDESIGPRVAENIMKEKNVDQNCITHVVKIIENISYKGGHTFSDFSSLELEIVRDADRLDAIGAIGIARAFHYGGFKNRKLYDPDTSPNLFMTREEYKSGTGPTINHFY